MGERYQPIACTPIRGLLYSLLELRPSRQTRRQPANKHQIHTGSTRIGQDQETDGVSCPWSVMGAQPDTPKRKNRNSSFAVMNRKCRSLATASVIVRRLDRHPPIKQPVQPLCFHVISTFNWNISHTIDCAEPISTPYRV